MAFPVVSSTTTTSISANSANPAVHLPAGVAAGDTLIGIYRAAGAGAISFPTGWTELLESDADSSDDVLVVAWRKADGGEASSTTVLTTGSVKGAWACYRISNATDPTVTPPEAAAVATGSSANPDPPNLAASAGAFDNLWLAISTTIGSPTVTAYPTAFSSGQVWSDAAGGGATGTRCTVASSASSLNASSLNPAAYTISASNVWMATTVVIYPAPDAVAGATISPYYAHYYYPTIVVGSGG